MGAGSMRPTRDAPPTSVSAHRSSEDNILMVFSVSALSETPGNGFATRLLRLLSSSACQLTRIRVSMAFPRLGGSAPEAPLPARPETEVLVDVAEEDRIATPWRVVLYNDEIHTFEEVISQLIKATGCSSSHAEKIAWQVHLEGKAVAYEGEFEECFRVQGVLREIQLVTEIEG